jgi:hypothetical protein
VTPAAFCYPLPQRAGIGLKPDHYRDVLAAAMQGTGPAFAEIHPQNYFGEGGPPHRWLTAVAEKYPLSFHSVGLSLGSAAGVNSRELEQLAQLCDRYQPALVSDHLSWSSAGGEHFPDLLALPMTEATLAHCAEQVDRVQSRLGRNILVENPSRLVAFAADGYGEGEFMNALARRTGCGILLDLNNIDVSAFNLGRCPVAEMRAFDPALVREIHVAGHSRRVDDEGLVVAIDDHGSAVSDACWDLLRQFTAQAGPRPVTIEWDNHVPQFGVLMAETARADHCLAAAYVDA